MRDLSVLMFRSGLSLSLYSETVPYYCSKRISISPQLAHHRYFEHQIRFQFLCGSFRPWRNLPLLAPILYNHLVQIVLPSMNIPMGTHVGLLSILYALGRLTPWLLRRRTQLVSMWDRCSSWAHIHSLPFCLNNCILQLRLPMACLSNRLCYCYYFLNGGPSIQFQNFHLCSVFACVLVYSPWSCL